MKQLWKTLSLTILGMLLCSSAIFAGTADTPVPAAASAAARISSTDCGLKLEWTPIPGADMYVLTRKEKGSNAQHKTVFDEKGYHIISPVPAASKYPKPEDPNVLAAINAVQPLPPEIFPPVYQVLSDPSGNITGYAFTDSLVVPGREYVYSLQGFHIATGIYSPGYTVSGTWNITVPQIHPGTQLSEEAVSQMGLDSFFYAIEIPDDIFENRMYGNSYKEYCTVPRENLRYIRCLHRNKDDEILVGELVMEAQIAQTVCDIFKELYLNHYPVEHMILVDEFDHASDEDSIMHNNTSAFNYRTVDNTDQISDHAYGRAIDINPYYNVYYIPSENDYVFPPLGHVFLDRSSGLPYILTEGDLCYQLFMNNGFNWGGYFGYNIDYQHFYYTGY